MFAFISDLIWRARLELEVTCGGGVHGTGPIVWFVQRKAAESMAARSVTDTFDLALHLAGMAHAGSVATSGFGSRQWRSCQKVLRVTTLRQVRKDSRRLKAAGRGSLVVTGRLMRTHCSPLCSSIVVPKTWMIIWIKDARATAESGTWNVATHRTWTNACRTRLVVKRKSTKWISFVHWLTGTAKRWNTTHTVW